MDEFESINRAAVIISLKKPFIEWIKYVDSEAQYLDEKHDSKAIYLLPEVSDTGKSERYLKKNFQKIFEHELGGWYTDPSLWPKDRSWKVFNEWLDYEIHSMIFDVLDEPIEKE